MCDRSEPDIKSDLPEFMDKPRIKPEQWNTVAGSKSVPDNLVIGNFAIGYISFLEHRGQNRITLTTAMLSGKLIAVTQVLNFNNKYSAYGT
ncbi:MAG: hypothetical protein WDZ86_01505 [Gammaproteobacteria bacterium]